MNKTQYPESFTTALQGFDDTLAAMDVFLTSANARYEVLAGCWRDCGHGTEGVPGRGRDVRGD
jgi:hypothetical protein